MSDKWATRIGDYVDVYIMGHHIIRFPLTSQEAEDFMTGKRGITVRNRPGTSAPAPIKSAEPKLGSPAMGVIDTKKAGDQV